MASLTPGFTRLSTASALTIATTVLVVAGTINLVTSRHANAARKTSDARSSSSLGSPRYFPRVKVKTDPAGSSLKVNTPLLTETRLTASDGAPGNKFGSAVAVSGITVVIADNSSIYVFVRSNGIWAQQQKLSASGHLAIDGNTLVAAAGNNFRVFVRNGAIWTSQQVVALDSVAPASSVAISGDTIVVGIESDMEGCPETSVGGRGAALVFVRDGTSWTRQQKLVANDGQCSYEAVIGNYIHYGDVFGHSVAISGDTILVGAYAAHIGTHVEAGAAYVFGRSGGPWTQQQKLTASDVSMNDYFGFSVAISNDTAAIGAIGAGVGPYQPGFAYAFGRSNGVWSEQQKFTANLPPDSLTGFGFSVAVTGETIVVGCDSDQPAQGVGSPGPLGSAYWYRRSGSIWIEQPRLMASDGAQGDSFGRATAISGSLIVVGAYGDDTTAGSDAGSAYVFENDLDTIPPSLTVPANITTNATSSNGAVVNYVVTASDSLDPNPIVVSVPASGSLFPIGATTVNSTATDASGNSASASFTVNVLDATPTPNPCLDPVPPTLAGSLRKSVAMGNAPVSNPDAIGGQYDLLFRYNPTDPNSPCATNPAELDASSNIALLKNSGTTWVRLWVDWSALDPYSPAQFSTIPESCKQPVLDRRARLLGNLDLQIRTAHKEKLQVILTVFHGYPLWTNDSRIQMPLPSPPLCEVRTCEQVCNTQACKNRCKLRADPNAGTAANARNAFGKVPTSFASGGPWAQFIALLVERYGLTKKKIDRERQPCSHNFNGEGCGDYLRYVDFLEVVNEPNLTHWPQRNPDRNNGSLSMPGKVAQMFVRAQSIVEARNGILRRQVPPGLDDGMTTVKLLGPATADISTPGPSKTYKSTSYYEFTRALFARLKARDFEPGPNFAWSHHNYLDVEYFRHEPPRRAGNRLTDPDECATNSAAWTRRLLNLGDSGYRWEGWPSGTTSAELLITESGARLVNMPKLWPLAGSDEFAQAALVEENFKLMNAGRLAAGIAMVNNYLTYSDPKYDTGLLDYIGHSCDAGADWHDRAGCARSRTIRVPCRGSRLILPCVCTGVGGARRPVYEKWKVLAPTR